MEGATLRKKLLDLDFVLADVAKTMNTTPQALNSKLSAKDLTLSFLLDIAKAINKSVYDLVDLPPMPEGKDVIPIGKHSRTRLAPGQFGTAFKDWMGVPMYNAPVTASFIELYHDETAYKPTYYLHDARFKDCNFGAIITGDSMHSEIRHGDQVICKEILDTRFIVYGDIYYIVATNGLQTCKYINADPKNDDNFLLVPKNESISPSPIPKDMIEKIFKVRGVLRGY